MDIIRISKAIKRLIIKKPKPKPPLKLKYGDSRRVPNQYILTKTTKSPLVDFSPQFYSELLLDDYKTFSSLSEILVIRFFEAIGVRYVPEIVIYLLKEQTPIEAFSKFCATFGGNANRVDANRLNDVIFRLTEMDELRRVYALNTVPIYEALRVDVDRADELIEQMREVIIILESRDDITIIEQDNMIDNWYQKGMLKKIKKKYSQ